MISEWDRGRGILKIDVTMKRSFRFRCVTNSLVPREPSPLRGTCKINPDNAYPCMFLKNSDPLS